jgi:hypothetical protein
MPIAEVHGQHRSEDGCWLHRRHGPAGIEQRAMPGVAHSQPRRHPQRQRIANKRLHRTRGVIAELHVRSCRKAHHLRQAPCVPARGPVRLDVSRSKI